MNMAPSLNNLNATSCSITKDVDSYPIQTSKHEQQRNQHKFGLCNLQQSFKWNNAIRLFSRPEDDADSRIYI